jgi:hypothetical protein
MATGPLSLLGDALQQGSRDYLSIRRTDERNAELRNQQLADETRRRQEMLADDGRNRERQLEDQRTQRGYVEADRTNARSYEQDIYDKRRYDSIILSLIKDGHLDKKEIDNPAAVAGALKKGGVQYERDLAELAKYKAALPDLSKAAGEVEGAEAIMNMGVDDLPAARAIMGRITAKIGKDSQQRQDDDQTNREGFSEAFAANQVAGALLAQRKEEAENALAAIANRELPPDVMARIQTEVLTENRALAKNKVELAKAVEAKIEKALELAFVATQTQLVTLEREMTANANAGRVITAAGSAGGFRKTSTALGAEAPTAGKTTEAAPKPAAKTKPGVPDVYVPPGAKAEKAGGGTAAASLGTADPVAAPVVAAPTTPAVVAGDDSYGGLMAVGAALKKPAPSWLNPVNLGQSVLRTGGALASNTLALVPDGLNYAAGGSKRLAEGRQERSALSGRINSGIAALGDVLSTPLSVEEQLRAEAIASSLSGDPAKHQEALRRYNEVRLKNNPSAKPWATGPVMKALN